jgi:hypothetical protein
MIKIMDSAHTQLSETVQMRLEAISMRLDAATDNLLQTRDLLISHFENQLLQLQDVRSALHETAKETVALAQAAEGKTRSGGGSQPGGISPMQGMSLESLFAPLNAVPHLQAAEEVASPVVGRFVAAAKERAPTQEFEVLPPETLFETEPLPTWEASAMAAAVEQPQPAMMSAAQVNVGQVERGMPMGFGVVNASHALQTQGDLDPELEKATLDELNEALTRAFAQIATRHAHSH